MLPIVLPQPEKQTLYTGIAPAASPALGESWLQDQSAPLSIVVVKDYPTAMHWAEDLPFFRRVASRTTEIDIRVLPETSALGETEEHPQAFDWTCDRLAILSRLNALLQVDTAEVEPLILIATPDALFQATPKPESLTAKEITVLTGQELDFQQLINRLGNELGYDAEAVCEHPGQFAVRGGLIDIYPINADLPYRIDFFGDEVEAIRTFDPTDQRSLGQVQSLTIAGLLDSAENIETTGLWEYLPASIAWIFVEPDVLVQNFSERFTTPEKISSPQANFLDLLDHRKTVKDTNLGLSEWEPTSVLFDSKARRYACKSELLSSYRMPVLEDNLGVDRFQLEQETRRRFLKRIADWQGEAAAVFCVCRNSGEEQRLREVIDEDPSLADLKPFYLQGELTQGFKIELEKTVGSITWPQLNDKSSVVLVTDAEIFGRSRIRPLGKRRRRLAQATAADQLLDFSELAEGDHLVHLQHGICIYRGLTKIENRGAEEEMISLEFDEGLRLHLPLAESHLLTRYVGLAKTQPKLGVLGGNRWKKTWQKAEQGALDFAAELLRLQADRQTKERPPCQMDTEWQEDFEASFAFRETDDQLRAINEVKEDLETDTPMDRLLFGDVGFGKTEIALRAAFKMATNHKQACILAPTTVLAQQHFNTFKERMADYPIVIEMISRFRTPKEQRAILKQLKEGQIDIIVGTHRLISQDVSFANLGLLVIDEEHRFGVRHKEKLKRLRSNVDVLSMSATPIPRTLYFALMGVRNLSVIETPPAERLPIETVVRHYDWSLIKKAIQLELERGGQVFYLHNRVQTIQEVAARLSESIPDLRVAVGHGQMEEGELEKVMTGFVSKEYDVLVCTTIIESGLDIPNCNTLIIEGADRFGLAQLYQLRGRVGRSTRQGYAYLLLHNPMALDDSARKRLAALRRYNQLGAGFKIALRDLELRGAGNLLGSQQSGFIAGVGFDLYCQLLRQSISRLQGDPNAIPVRCTLRLDFVLIGGKENIRGDSASLSADLDQAPIDPEQANPEILEAFIPTSYLAETRLRIEFYRRLSLADNEEVVDAIAEELGDRFGPYPQSVQALIEVHRLRSLAERNRIQMIDTEGPRLKLLRASGKRDDFVQLGNRFPKLREREPFAKLREITQCLQGLHRPKLGFTRNPLEAVEVS